MDSRKTIHTNSAFSACSAVILLSSLVAVSCSGDNRPSGPSSTNTAGTNTPTITRPTGSFGFRASPIDPAFIEFIAPLGNLNPPGHTLPTDHIYLYHRLNNPSAPPRVVVAPADGTVQYNIDNGAGSDRKLGIVAAFPYSYYLDHVVPDAAIQQGSMLKAGQRIGMTGTSLSFGLDLGVMSDAIAVPFVNPGRYTDQSLHGDAPLKYFDEPIRSQLYALVRRSSGDRDGTFNYDIPGTLSGNWFAETLAVADTQNNNNGSLHLSFAYDNFDPGTLRISSGGALGFSGTPTIVAGTPEPRDVTPATGKVVYHVLYTGEALARGVLLVQMLDVSRIRIEYLDGDRATAEFTASARTYVR